MLAFIHEGKSLLVGGGNPFITMKDGAVKKYDVEKGELLSTVISKNFPIQAASLSADGKRLLIACVNVGGEADRHTMDMIRQRNRGLGAPKEPKKDRPKPQDVFVEVWAIP